MDSLRTRTPAKTRALEKYAHTSPREMFAVLQDHTADAAPLGRAIDYTLLQTSTTAQSFAHDCRCSKQAVSGWRRGRRKASPDACVKAASLLAPYAFRFTVDRLSLVLPYQPSPDDLQSIAETWSGMGRMRYRASPRSPYRQTCRLRDENGETVTFQWGPRFENASPFRVEWNPSNVTPGQVCALQRLIALSGGVESARVTRIDEAVDFVGIDLEQVLADLPRARTWANFDHGYAVGSRKSRIRLSVYDHRRRHGGMFTVRVEAQRRLTREAKAVDASLCALESTLTDPFARVLWTVEGASTRHPSEIRMTNFAGCMREIVRSLAPPSRQPTPSWGQMEMTK